MSVINAAVVVFEELPPPVESVESESPPLPHAPNNNPADNATAPKPNNFAFFISVKPPKYVFFNSPATE